MTKHLGLLAAVGLALALGTACDSDGDGLKNGEEKDLGLDPKNPDVDGDGLLDGEDPNPNAADADNDYLDDAGEVAAGSDPNNPDTDGDGYLDGDEVLEGSDPTDAKSKIYKGGWPYNRNKDELKGKVGTVIEVGVRMPRLELRDQFGDKVDLYDFAGQGKDIIIDLSALNCGPCLATAAWLDTGDDAYFEDLFGPLRKGVNQGDVYWLTFAYTSYYSPSASDDGVVDEWYDQFHNKNVPIFADDDLEVWDFAYQGGMPFFALLNDKMIVQAYDLGIGAGTTSLVEAQNNL